MVGCMLTCRQTWGWKSCEFYIQILRQHEERDPRPGLKSQIPPPRTHFLQQVAPFPDEEAFRYMSLWCHYYSNHFISF
ncbi:hypothetical protein I79_007094 [Cricetulus griseus]|uniref:Uncharacterized protein n=1 Tax=Cricetulus griseus TaxID=10029 RepID=G3H9L8_CRIGR|nr:hypothetical protein I79_007094 [Cricetulus griseus]